MVVFKDQAISEGVPFMQDAMKYLDDYLASVVKALPQLETATLEFGPKSHYGPSFTLKVPSTSKLAKEFKTQYGKEYPRLEVFPFAPEGIAASFDPITNMFAVYENLAQTLIDSFNINPSQIATDEYANTVFRDLVALSLYDEDEDKITENFRINLAHEFAHLADYYRHGSGTFSRMYSRGRKIKYLQNRDKATVQLLKSMPAVSNTRPTTNAELKQISSDIATTAYSNLKDEITAMVQTVVYTLGSKKHPKAEVTTAIWNAMKKSDVYPWFQYLTPKNQKKVFALIYSYLDQTGRIQ